jgi:hypothetical protein
VEPIAATETEAPSCQDGPRAATGGRRSQGQSGAIEPAKQGHHNRHLVALLLLCCRLGQAPSAGLGSPAPIMTDLRNTMA